MNSFREYLKDCEIKDFYESLKEETYNYNKIVNHNKYPLVQIIHEAVITPESIEIKSSLDDLASLNHEFSKLKIIFKQIDNPKNLYGYYKQENDEIYILYSIKNSKKEIEAMIGHEMIHRAQNKKSKGYYFDRAKKLTAEINKLADEYNITQNAEVLNLYKQKSKFKDFDDSYEQMAYVYQTVKENPDLTPNQLIQYFKNLGFKIDYRLKKYIGMYWLIRDII